MKKTVLLFILSLLVGFTSIAQETIAFEGFEDENGPFQLLGNYTGNASGGSPSGAAHAFEGSRAFGVFNGEQTITSQAISTLGYEGISLSLKNLGWGSSTLNGFRNNDFLRIEISEDNGDTWVPVVQTLGQGFGGYQWNYSATGVAEGIYNGAATTLASFQQSNSTSPRTDAYSTLIITGIPAVAELRVRIAIKTNSGNTFLLCVDQIELTGTLPACVTPSLTSTAGDERCDEGTLTLSATADGGIIRWFDAEMGGTQVGTGSPFTTPTLSETTTFWVEAHNDIDDCSSSRIAVQAVINGEPEFTQEPTNETVCIGTESLSLTAEASGTGTLFYQWQMDDGNGFMDLLDNATFEGSATNELLINNPDENLNGAVFRVTVTDDCGQVSSASAILTVEQIVGSDIVSACGEFTWINGNTYTESTNTPTFTLEAANGCDSLVTLNLTINELVFGTDEVTACGEFTWLDGNTYTESTNTPTFTLEAANGCDSLVTLNLTITALDNSVTTTETSITANQAGANYQWIDCATNSPISGADNASFAPTQSGSYAVVITSTTDASCSVTSDCINFEIEDDVSTSNVTLEKITVFPNPAKDYITLTGLAQTDRIVILDNLGKQLYTQTVNQPTATIAVSHLPKGIYLIQVANQQAIRTTKLIVN